MLHAAIARPQKVVALIGIATAVDGLVIQFNQLPTEVRRRQPQHIPVFCFPEYLLTCHLSFELYAGPSFVLAFCAQSLYPL